MSKIKSLAEQLKSRLEEQKSVGPIRQNLPEPDLRLSTKPRWKNRTSVDQEASSAFLSSLEQFRMEGSEKILIRLDKRTMNLLRRLKLASGIDMTKIIVFSLDRFLYSHPWLNEYISQTLKKYEP